MAGPSMAAMFANSSSATDLPPLPEYTLSEIPALLPFISDFWLIIIAPHVAYWIASLVFHCFDVFDLFPQYRLHTPEEITQRNHASRWDVFRDVILEQIIQIFTAAVLSLSEPAQLVGKEDYDVAVWATRIRLAQRSFPVLLGLLGLNATSISKNMAASHPMIAGVLAGGHYPSLMTSLGGVAGVQVPAFAAWELYVAKFIYYAVVPAFQLFVAVCFLDAWQYFIHRLMHNNKWLYTHLHARHHRLYVPYAYGALYNTPAEGLVMDALGPAAAYKISCMTPRMSLIFFVGSAVKTVDDHCGYALPWDPLQHLTGNNAAYHDIHHQSWGIKSNFSQPFFIFWDRVLGTMWKGDTRLRYERDRVKAAKKAEAKAQQPRSV